MYKLSICIPTRNRPEELIKTLSTIINQLKVNNFQNNVEIVIADNTDVESLKIKSELLSYKNVHYMNNDGNIGYANNINKLIKNAKGEYVWLLSDDDFISDNAVSIIIQTLNSGKRINYLTFYTGGCFQGKLFDDNIYFKEMSKTYFDNGIEFLDLYWQSIIFVSCNIFNRNELICHAEKYSLFDNINEVFQNSLLCISFINNNGFVMVIPDVLVNDNYGNKEYSVRTEIDVPILKNIKLLYQFKDLNVSPVVCASLKDIIIKNICFYGLRSLIRYIEFDGHSEIKNEFRYICKNIKDRDIQKESRKIYLIFLLNRFIAKIALKIFLKFKIIKGTEYVTIKEDLKVSYNKKYLSDY